MWRKSIPKLVYQPLSWRTLMEKIISLASPIAVTADDIAFIQYTGATTGILKAQCYYIAILPQTSNKF